MKMHIFLKVHGMEVVECGARRDTLSHTWASDQSWKVQTAGSSRIFLPSSQEPR